MSFPFSFFCVTREHVCSQTKGQIILFVCACVSKEGEIVLGKNLKGGNEKTHQSTSVC